MLCIMYRMQCTIDIDAPSILNLFVNLAIGESNLFGQNASVDVCACARGAAFAGPAAGTGTYTQLPRLKLASCNSQLKPACLSHSYMSANNVDAYYLRVLMNDIKRELRWTRKLPPPPSVLLLVNVLVFLLTGLPLSATRKVPRAFIDDTPFSEIEGPWLSAMTRYPFSKKQTRRGFSTLESFRG